MELINSYVYTALVYHGLHILVQGVEYVSLCRLNNVIAHVYMMLCIYLHGIYRYIHGVYRVSTQGYIE